MRSQCSAEGLLGIEGFTRFLFGAECDFVNPEHVAHVYQDMTRPLSHYFIAASHNTYLMDDQLRGPSSPDAYIQALLMGCRCVVRRCLLLRRCDAVQELDCWDGENGDPIIYHGHTLTSKARRLAVTLCRLTAADPLRGCDCGHQRLCVQREPVPGDAVDREPLQRGAASGVLLVGVRGCCDVVQLMAKYMRDIFKEKLYTEVDAAGTELPSPAQLQFKILVKNKKLAAGVAEAEVSDEDEAEEGLARIRVCMLG